MQRFLDKFSKGCELEFRRKCSPDEFIKVYNHMQQLVKDGKCSEPTFKRLLESVGTDAKTKSPAKSINDVTVSGKPSLTHMRKEHIDRTSIKHGATDFKLVLSREIPTTIPPSSVDMIRMKMRSSFVIGDWRYDFTIVGQYRHSQIIKEIAVKFMEPAASYNEETFLKAAQTRISFMHDNKPITVELELEIEYVGSTAPSTDAIRVALDILPHLNEHVQYTAKIISMLGMKGSSIKEITPQPATLNLSNYMDIQSELGMYYVTYKADGYHALVHLANDNCFYVTAKDYAALDFDIKPGTNHIFDAEIVDDQIYVFDILMYNGTVTTELDFDKRIELLDKVADKQYHIKKHVPLGAEPHKTLEKFLKSEPDFETDGIILTYSKGSYKHSKIYKWKPIEKLSIDFLAMRAEGGSANALAIPGYDLYYLFSGSQEMNIPQEMIPSMRDYIGHIKPALFRSNLWPNAHLYYHPKSGADLNRHIIEMFWDAPADKPTANPTVPTHWKFMRIRTDKEDDIRTTGALGNFITVAAVNFASIVNPLTKDMLLDPPQSYFQSSKDDYYASAIKYNTSVKKRLMIQLKDVGSVLDICSGKGQDVQTYAKLGVKNVTFVEQDSIAVIELNNRYEQLKGHKYAATILNKNAYPVTSLESSLPNNSETSPVRYDAIVINLAIHYLLHSAEDVAGFADFCKLHLNPLGKVIFTTLNGAAVFAEITKSATGDLSIMDGETRKYHSRLQTKPASTSAPTFGNGFQIIEIKHHFGDEYYPEYLLNIDLIIAELERRGFAKLHNYSFSRWADDNFTALSDADKKYVSLYQGVSLIYAPGVTGSAEKPKRKGKPKTSKK